MDRDTRNLRSNGLSVRAVFIPFLIALTILHATIIFLIFRINSTSANLSATMNRYSNYRSEVTSLLSHISAENDAMASLLLSPLAGKDQLNSGPVSAFVSEFNNDFRDPSAILEDFEGYGLPEGILSPIKRATDIILSIEAEHLHSLAVLRSAYPEPEIPILRTVTLPALAPEEAALSADEKVSLAKAYAMSSAYAEAKMTVSDCVNEAMEGINVASAGFAASTGRSIARIQLAIRITTFTIIAVIFILVLIVYFNLVIPLYKIVKNIRTDSPTNDKEGLREIRLISAAYNNLIARRANFEDFLRSTTDSGVLARLPDRNDFDARMAEFQRSVDGGSVFLVMFEVTDFDKTKKSLGNAAAEQLLKTAAECVVKCFGNSSNDNCFTYDFNRFAVICPNTSRESIDEAVEMFTQQQSKWGISIFWGIASVEDRAAFSADALIKEAERKLYIQKKVMFSDL